MTLFPCSLSNIDVKIFFQQHLLLTSTLLSIGGWWKRAEPTASWSNLDVKNRWKPMEICREHKPWNKSHDTYGHFLSTKRPFGTKWSPTFRLKITPKPICPVWMAVFGWTVMPTAISTYCTLLKIPFKNIINLLNCFWIDHVSMRKCTLILNVFSFI